MVSEDKLREEIREAFKNRAILYFLIYDEFRQELGAERAEEIMKRAIYRRGIQKAEKYKQYAPADFEGLRDAFVSGVPDDGRLFDPRVQRCDAEGLDINLESCPLKEAWEELELNEDERVTMCRIAGEIDKGTFEAAGFSFEPDTWKPGRSGCCHLHISLGK